MGIETAVEGALRRDRWVSLAALSAVIAASCAYLLSGAGMGISAIEMTRMEPIAGLAMPPAAWSPGHAVMMFAMWWVMMVAMMLPSATPMILLFATVQRRQRREGNPYVSTSLFTASYLATWAAFSLAATGAHWGLSTARLIGPQMALTSHFLGAALLVAAGLYQLTPLKQACLSHCRSPAHSLAKRWRRGRWPAIVMGLQHGSYCLGCCWFLMLLLFFGGVMSLYWIAGLAVYVLVEKSIPSGHWLDYGLGFLLAAAGVWLFGLSVMPE